MKVSLFCITKTDTKVDGSEQLSAVFNARDDGQGLPFGPIVIADRATFDGLTVGVAYDFVLSGPTA